jgi:hypothetical protein
MKISPGTNRGFTADFDPSTSRETYHLGWRTGTKAIGVYPGTNRGSTVDLDRRTSRVIFQNLAWETDHHHL